MSCTYADGLSPYEHKGILGVPEKFESPENLKEKCDILTKWIKESKHIVVHTGAGISTSAGIPDFRGPKGVWTLEEKGLKPEISISFMDAKPTYTHMALKTLVEEKMIHYIVSQNIDGLHLKSGLNRSFLAELHGNMFIEQCNVCKKQFVRSSPAPTVGQKLIGKPCHNENSSSRSCRGKLHDIILDWEHSLPDDDLEMADLNSCIADLSICLGTTLQIVPSGNLPLNTLKYGGKLVICNLQPTKHDNKADLIINSYVDDIMQLLMKNLNKEVVKYSVDSDPTKSGSLIDWTVCKKQLKLTKTTYKKQCDGVLKKRVLVKKQINNSNILKNRLRLRKPIPKRKTKKSKLKNKNVTKKESDVKVSELNLANNTVVSIDLAVEDEIEDSVKKSNHLIENEVDMNKFNKTNHHVNKDEINKNESNETNHVIKDEINETNSVINDDIDMNNIEDSNHAVNNEVKLNKIDETNNEIKNDIDMNNIEEINPATKDEIGMNKIDKTNSVINDNIDMNNIDVDNRLVEEKIDTVKIDECDDLVTESNSDAIEKKESIANNEDMSEII